MMQKTKPRFGALTVILLIVDLALLVLIISAWNAQRKQAEPGLAGSAEQTIWDTEQPAGKPETIQKPEQPAGKPETVQTPEEPQENANEGTPEMPNWDVMERPTDADFLEWYAKDAMWNGAPAGVEHLTEFAEVTGTWKGLIYYDPENRYDAEGVQLLNFTVGGTAEAVTMTADWYSIYFVADGKGYSEEEQNDSVYVGAWENGGLRATGPGTIRLTEFYTLGGTQYAIGQVDTPDGIPASIAMVRP